LPGRPSCRRLRALPELRDVERPAERRLAAALTIDRDTAARSASRAGVDDTLYDASGSAVSTIFNS